MHIIYILYEDAYNGNASVKLCPYNAVNWCCFFFFNVMSKHVIYFIYTSCRYKTLNSMSFFLTVVKRLTIFSGPCGKPDNMM